MRKSKRPPNILVIDNYDSFTFNLVQYLGELGAQVKVFRNDAISVGQIAKEKPDGILLSPGPGTPDEGGVTLEAIKVFAGKISLLGVCLGHQAIAQAFGGKVVLAKQVMHGKTSPVVHKKEGVFSKLPSPFLAGRYHALCVDPKKLPKDLKVTAWVKDGTVMGIRHKKLDVEGVQFHPESILSEHGHQLLSNWLGRLEGRS